MNSGSFFLAEIRRMMSSLNPRGAASTSTSVTNPYLYSWLARASIVLVEVLMISPFISVLVCSHAAREIRSSGYGTQRRDAPRGQLGEQRLQLSILFGAEDDMRNALLHYRTRVHGCAGGDRQDRKAGSELLHGGDQKETTQTVCS